MCLPRKGITGAGDGGQDFQVTRKCQARPTGLCLQEGPKSVPQFLVYSCLREPFPLWSYPQIEVHRLRQEIDAVYHTAKNCILAVLVYRA